ncbi:MAG: alpha-amylase/4-alpha-glucanotransferase domain-containing protein, partial [Candidatus Rokuibacteriota bacterium]
VSLSEAGFERIYQGSALLCVWPVRLPPGQTWETSLRLAIAETAARVVGETDAGAAQSGDSA